MGKLIAAQSSLERAVAELNRSGGSTSAADGQLSILASLQVSVGTASATSLAAMSSAVATAVAQSKALADQAREQASAAETGSVLTLADARRSAKETIAALDDDLYKKKIFDPYLRFGSAEDQRAYRQREEENRRALAAARAKGTPEGDLEALAVEKRQLLDAGAHGADRSEEWRKRMESIGQTRDNLGAAMRDTGHTTDAANAIERDSARTFLKAKGLSDTEIAQAMSRGDSVAKAIEPYVTAPPAENTSKPDARLDSLASALRAAGVAPTASSAQDGHGVAVAVAQSSTVQRA